MNVEIDDGACIGNRLKTCVHIQIKILNVIRVSYITYLCHVSYIIYVYILDIAYKRECSEMSTIVISV